MNRTVTSFLAGSHTASKPTYRPTGQSPSYQPHRPSTSQTDANIPDLPAPKPKPPTPP